MKRRLFSVGRHLRATKNTDDGLSRKASSTFFQVPSVGIGVTSSTSPMSISVLASVRSALWTPRRKKGGVILHVPEVLHPCFPASKSHPRCEPCSWTRTRKSCQRDSIQRQSFKTQFTECCWLKNTRVPVCKDQAPFKAPVKQRDSQGCTTTHVLLLSVPVSFFLTIYEAPSKFPSIAIRRIEIYRVLQAQTHMIACVHRSLRSRGQHRALLQHIVCSFPNERHRQYRVRHHGA